MSLSVINSNPQQDRQNNSQTKEEAKAVNLSQMFRFANRRDFLFIGLGTLCSIVIGAALPFFSLLWGNMTDAFKQPDNMVSMALDIFIQYVLFGIGSIFGGWGMQYFWLIAGESQANKCRKHYIESLMMQEIGWYETQQSSQIVSRFISDTLAFQLAIGDKIALVIYLISMFISGLIISFTRGWKMTLVVLACVPLLVFSWWLMEFYTKRRMGFEQQNFQEASGLAQQYLQAVIIVKQMNGEEHQQIRFDKKILKVKERSLSFNIRQSLSNAFSLFILLFAFTLSYWFGSQCVQGTANCPSSPQENPYSGGVVLTIFFSLVIPAVNLNQLAPSLEVITQGRTAAARIFAIIDREPLIKSVDNPLRLTDVKGVIRFEDVTFSYPKDKSKIILSNLNMTIDCKSSGIMGQSGCGKSTILQLIMRLYDPDSGTITLDGVDIKQLDLHWLRSQIGYVGQEPLLFSQSIKENLLIGKQDASNEEMMLALRNAEILDFVAQLSDNVNTYVGSGGSQLSGGQKQRIAIARALLKNPTILLLDEATSALDRRNERLIQHSLNKVITDKISITVAHRLQTINNCDKIYALDKGKLQRQEEPIKKLQHESAQVIQQAQNEDQFELINHTLSKSTFQRIAHKKSYNGFNSLSKLDSAKELVNQQHERQQKKRQENSTYSRLFSYAERKKLVIVVGIVSSLVHGLVMPSMGIHIARILAFNLLFSTNKEYYSSQIRTECYYMVATCIVGPIAMGLQHFTSLLIGSSIISKVRQNLFRKALRLPVSWFQSKENNIEKVSMGLGADMITMSHIISRYFSHLCVALSSIIFGLLLAFYFEWRTVLVSIGLIPLIGISGLFQSKMASGYLTQSNKLYQQSSKILSESLDNLKTVLSFCSQKRTIDKYMNKLDDIQSKQFNKKLISAIIFGVSFLILFVVYGLIFYLAAVFIRSNDLEITNAFSAVFLVLFSGMIAGNNAKNIPDLGRLKVIADKLFEIMDLKDQNELQLMNGSKRLDKQIKGIISFRKVSFKYENRDEITLKNVSFDIKQGEKIGIVGSSGCGKSTILKLLLGFYQCSEGSIIIDGEPIEDYDIHCLRKHFCTVSQEPELFNETVKYNIIYNMKGVDDQMFIDAVLKAKLRENRQSLQSQQSEHFFKRQVGPRGSHLSGGQKQRVAIARAILRKPNILLLDEATSALDKQNELKVQQCLETVMIGRTSLNVTHKLQTLGNSSRILVFKHGEIVEEGTYDELLQNKNNFYRLLNGLDH